MTLTQVDLFWKPRESDSCGGEEHWAMAITAAWPGLGAPVCFLAVQRTWVGDGVCREYSQGQTNKATRRPCMTEVPRWVLWEDSVLDVLSGEGPVHLLQGLSE